VLESSKNFTWTITSYEESKITIQLLFASPGYISLSTFDKLRIEYPEAQKYLIYALTQVKSPQGLDLSSNGVLKKQIYEPTKRQIEAAASSAGLAFQLLTIGNVAVAIFAQGSLQHLWSSINSLQLTIHMPLINIPFPANAQILFQELIKIVTFDFLEIKDALGIEQEFDFTETFAYNDNFDELGYGTQNTVDLLGSINFIIAILLTRILLFVLYRPVCCNRTKVCRKIKSKAP